MQVFVLQIPYLLFLLRELVLVHLLEGLVFGGGCTSVGHVRNFRSGLSVRIIGPVELIFIIAVIETDASLFEEPQLFCC